MCLQGSMEHVVQRECEGHGTSMQNMGNVPRPSKAEAKLIVNFTTLSCRPGALERQRTYDGPQLLCFFKVLQVVCMLQRVPAIACEQHGLRAELSPPWPPGRQMVLLKAACVCRKPAVVLRYLIGAIISGTAACICSPGADWKSTM